MSSSGSLGSPVRIGRILILACACVSCAPYLLPLPDDRPPGTAPPSLQGQVVAIQGDRMFIDDQMHGQRAIRQIALTAATDYFSAFGGAIDREQLSPGIYVWVWYEHRNPLRSGNPPRAAVVMPFSLDPDDQPEDARCDFGT